jgi:hypothetical protein
MEVINLDLNLLSKTYAVIYYNTISLYFLSLSLGICGAQKMKKVKNNLGPPPPSWLEYIKSKTKQEETYTCN